MNLAQIKEIVSTYQKYEWKLRVFLLDEESHTQIRSELEDLYKTVEIRLAKIDAAWFSRPSKHDREAWELRALSEPPYALIETFANDQSEASRTIVRNEMEKRLAESGRKK
ncbi:MAG: hypothetical protein KDB79_08665 [Acidobacteria bacterium]|nr:hypothetical protein [Acidobacteriota bacterium]